MQVLNITGNWILSVILWVVLVITLGATIYYRVAIAKFFSEIKAELLKCTWPWDPEQKGLRRYKELIDSTIIVSVSSVLLAAYIAFFDFFISHLIKFIVKF